MLTIYKVLRYDVFPKSPRPVRLRDQTIYEDEKWAAKRISGGDRQICDCKIYRCVVVDGAMQWQELTAEEKQALIAKYADQ